MCLAGRCAPSSCEIVPGPSFSSPNQPDQERIYLPCQSRIGFVSSLPSCYSHQLPRGHLENVGLIDKIYDLK